MAYAGWLKQFCEVWHSLLYARTLPLFLVTMTSSRYMPTACCYGVRQVCIDPFYVVWQFLGISHGRDVNSTIRI